MRKYDAVVIGAGNGGLTAAIRLLQGGARVLLVEKHNIPGGFATSFRRGRFEGGSSSRRLCTSSTTSVPPTTRATSACSSTNSE